MNVILDLCMVPMGVGLSVSPYVARCQAVLQEAGFTPHLHAYGTTIEGDWDAVMAAVRRCHEAVHAMTVQLMENLAAFHAGKPVPNPIRES